MRTLDASKYRVNIPFIASMTGNMSDEQRVEVISRISVSSGVPIIVVCKFVQEIYGPSELIEGKMRRLMSFYEIDEV